MDVRWRPGATDARECTALWSSQVASWRSDGPDATQTAAAFMPRSGTALPQPRKRGAGLPASWRAPE
eukprot:12242116-Alexandrium_andersonii.AAC.1